MKNSQKFFGIYINRKIPKLKNNIYYGNIKLEFEGKAFIINNKKEKQELKNGSKYKKAGKYTIELINNQKEIYYININIIKLYPIFIFIMILLILLNIIYFSNTYIKEKIKINKSLDFDIELEYPKYNFNVSYKNQNFKSIKLTDKVTKNDMIYPGANGSFYIIINTTGGNKDINYIMQVQEENSKPKNLKFKINNIEYDSIKELSENIKGTIEKNASKILKIDWFWDYDSNEIIDTFDGININKYKFSIRIVGTENI